MRSLPVEDAIEDDELGAGDGGDDEYGNFDLRMLAMTWISLLQLA